MPEVHAALAAGTVSAGHADAIARAANRLDADERAELATMAPTLVADAARLSVETFSRKVRDRRPTPVTRRRAAPPRTAEVTTGGASVGRSSRHVPHPRQPRPGGRRPLLRRLRRRRRSRASQARHRAHARPAPGRRVHRSGDRDAGGRSTAAGGAARVDRPRDHAARSPRDHRLRDLRRPPLPPETVRRLACEATSSRSCWTARRRRRRRSSQTPRHRRSTPSIESHAPNLRRTRLPRALRGLRHPPPRGMEGRRPTDLANLIPLCSKHHHLIHEGQWRPPARAPDA